MKKSTIITIIIVTVLLGFLTGIYLYRIYKEDTIIETEKVAKTIGETRKVEEKDLKVSNSEEKTSPNCTIVLKVYYEMCNHLIEKRKNIEQAEVNMTEAEIKQNFKDWELQKFTRNRNCII